MTGTTPELSQAVIDEHAARLAAVNDALDAHGLAGHFDNVGILQRGQLAVLGVESVTRLGDEGYHMVALPTQFKPDTVEPGTEIVKPGPRGYFRLIFQTQEQFASSQLIVPIVDDAPPGFETPPDLQVGTDGIQGINAVLAAHNLRGFAHPTNAPVKRIEGLVDLNTENDTDKGRYYSVAIVSVRQPDGSVVAEPYVINSRSSSGIDGSIFSVIAKLSMFAGEPRIQLGDNYRPALGQLVTETSRGFYSKGQHGELRIPRITDSSIEGIRSAVKILRGETGIEIPDAAGVISTRDPMKQDPRFELSSVNQYGVSLGVPNFGPRELEASEAIKIRYLSIGELYTQLSRLEDAFTIAAVARELSARGILTVNDLGKQAGDNNQRLAFESRFQVQHGVYAREVIRDNPHEGRYPVEASIGRIAVNTGIARMVPDLHIGRVGWNELRSIAEANGTSLRLLTPEQALRAVENGNLDVVTSAATVKVLHDMGHLGINWQQLAAA